MARKILKVCAIILVYCLIWFGVELIAYGEIQYRIVDDIMMLFFIPTIWKATVKDDCGRDYVKRTGKCPICTDCPHNCPLEQIGE